MNVTTAEDTKKITCPACDGEGMTTVVEIPYLLEYHKIVLP